MFNLVVGSPKMWLRRYTLPEVPNLSKVEVPRQAVKRAEINAKLTLHIIHPRAGANGLAGKALA